MDETTRKESPGSDPSDAVVARYAPLLVEKAQEWLAREPGQEVAGLIAVAGSLLGRKVAATLPPDQRSNIETMDMVTLMPREDLAAFTMANAPSLGEWLPAPHGPGQRHGRQLGILIGIGDDIHYSLFQYDAT